MNAKVVNYTAEQTASIVEAFKAGTAVEAIALSVGKSVRSVIAKLSREGAYVAKAKAKAEGKAVTKAEMLAKVEVNLGVAAGTFASFEKATKAAIEALVEATANEFEGE
jgi:hypothetical protein